MLQIGRNFNMLSWNFCIVRVSNHHDFVLIAGGSIRHSATTHTDSSALGLSSLVRQRRESFPEGDSQHAIRCLHESDRWQFHYQPSTLEALLCLLCSVSAFINVHFWGVNFAILLGAPVRQNSFVLSAFPLPTRCLLSTAWSCSNTWQIQDSSWFLKCRKWQTLSSEQHWICTTVLPRLFCLLPSSFIIFSTLEIWVTCSK